MEVENWIFRFSVTDVFARSFECLFLPEILTMTDVFIY
jgi:hypothetical protein